MSGGQLTSIDIGARHRATRAHARDRTTPRRADAGEDVSLAKIAELVEFDQAIAASVLRMARSWGSCRLPSTRDRGDAVIRLGTVPLLNLVLGEYLTRLRTAAPLYDLSEDDLWAHAAAAQLAVRALMQECPSAMLPAVADDRCAAARHRQARA